MVKVVLALLVLLALATWWRSGARRAEAEESHPRQGQFVTVDGHPVHYLQTGSGPDVVLIHGASGNLRDMTFDFAERLAADYRVTMFDRPGLGYTPPLATRGVSVMDQADLLHGAARSLGIARPVVVGQSFGGAVAMAWAVRHPEDTAAIVSLAGATHPWEGDIEVLHRVVSTPVLGPALTWLISAWVPKAYVRGQVDGVFTPQPAPEGYADYIGLGLVTRPETLLANSRQRDTLKEELLELRQFYPDLEMPVEVVHGTADDIVGLKVHAEAMLRDVPQANLTRLEGIGHMPHHVAPEAVEAAIGQAAQRAGLR
ncbi:alpha/beta fold hydrolase [Pseudooceanicola sp. LIPI14-2-Ac024]|uniref:alpha/beta fold hydrolase n=1 Tax=Pseudooceanicola sp. LIPI14-2-Ac024 TaxID=3344875 RepID=UPI0035CEC4C6